MGLNSAAGSSRLKQTIFSGIPRHFCAHPYQARLEEGQEKDYPCRSNPKLPI
jgi:hypothetical protein